METAENKTLEAKPVMIAFVQGIGLAALCMFSGLLLIVLFVGTPFVGDAAIVAAVAALFGVLLLAFVYFISLAYKYTVTADKVIVEYHFGVSRMETLPLETVTEVMLSQTLWERIFKIATVNVYSMMGTRNLRLFGLKNAENVKQLIIDNRKQRLRILDIKL
jgi:membrane protein YdbS with pleckstrin-like domain